MGRVTLIAIALLTMTITASGEYVTAENGLRLREEPSTEARILEVIPYATEVSGEIKDGWMQTSDGYLKAEFLSDEDPLSEWTHAGSWLTTAYTHSGFNCADGSYPQAGYTIAANSLPIGTTVYISGVGQRTVCDRGPSSMPDEWLDIFMDEYDECVEWGMRNCEIWIVK